VVAAAAEPIEPAEQQDAPKQVGWRSATNGNN